MPDADPNPERRKRTVWLIAGGAASLLLPLLGAVYLHISSTAGGAGPSGRNDVFERRDAGDKRLVPSQAAVPVSALAAPPPSSLPTAGGQTQAAVGSSLDFIKPGAEMSSKFGDSPKAATATAAAPAAPPPAAAAPAPAPAAAKTPAKKGKKEFAMPKLQPTRGFSSMGGKGGHAAPAGAAPAGAPAGGGDAQDLLKNLPHGAADNPQLQQYLKGQGK
ncbi:MAG: hypothetical protein HY079_11875 [Elusimicrobia bacterium]|nr:hypothetical protein [Elusimicrobiota bacterium]